MTLIEDLEAASSVPVTFSIKLKALRLFKGVSTSDLARELKMVLYYI